MLKNNLLLGFIFIFTLPLQAYQFAGFEAGQIETSDEIERQQVAIRYTNIAQDVLWPYSEHNAASAWSFYVYKTFFKIRGADLEGLQYKIGRSFFITDFSQFIFWLGQSEVSNDTQLDNQFDFILEFNKVYDHLSVEIDIGSKNHLDLILPLTTDAFDIFGAFFSAKAIYDINDHWRGVADYKFISFDDDNKRQQIDLELKYAFQKYPKWLWLGLAANHLSHDQTSLNYWSPLNFISYGPRAEVGLPIINSWQFFAGGSLHIIKEKNFESGDGHYLQTGFRWGDREATYAEISYEDIKSSRAASKWTSDGLYLKLTHLW